MAPGIDQRMTLANVLPPVFICTVVGSIWSIYFKLHLVPMLQLTGSTMAAESAMHHKGCWQTAISQILAAMFALCFGRSLLGHPGTVSRDPEWMLGSQGSSDVSTRELKATGDRRFCKWCQTYKPDRCHHCRVCKRCVLKMDHHCPWIMNCVGFGNHKYFFLLVVYAVANCIFITLTMSESVQRSVVEETSPTDRFLLVLGLVLATIMGVLMGTFLSFHTWLLFKGMSTIEFCEKSLSGQSSSTGSKGVSYDLGAYKNLKAVLGPCWWLWLVPICPPEGAGVSFVSAPAFPDKTDLYAVAEPEWTGNEHHSDTLAFKA